MNENCQNQNFKKKLNQKYEIKETNNKGKGMFSLSFIPKNTFIIEYSGLVIDEESYEVKKQLIAEEKEKSYLHFYFMRIKKNLIIDASINGSDAKFINHSCDPNCVTQFWTVNKQQKIGIFSIKDIQKGTELSYDYRGEFGQKCFCNADKCRGTL